MPGSVGIAYKKKTKFQTIHSKEKRKSKPNNAQNQAAKMKRKTKKMEDQSFKVINKGNSRLFDKGAANVEVQNL